MPKALTGSTLLQVMHTASQAEAETLSAANPGKLIIFDETASTAKAAAVLASLESIASEASTNASVAAASLASVQRAVEFRRRVGEGRRGFRHRGCREGEGG